MTSKRLTVKAQNLETTVAYLRGRLEQIHNAQGAEGETLTNSFASLVGGMGGGFGGQSPLTSIEPIISNNRYSPLSLNPQVLTFFYFSDGIGAALVDGPVEDAVRGGLKFESNELDPDDLKEWDDFLERLEFYPLLKSVEKWARLYGGAGIIIQDGTDPRKPLDMKKIFGKKLTFYSANRWELISPSREAPHYNFWGETIDASRVITLAGKEPPWTVKWMLQGWGMSFMESLIPPINIYKRNENAVYDLLREAKIDVYKFIRFNSTLATQKGLAQILQRVQLLNMAKSNSNAVLLDKDDDFAQKQMTFAGLSSIWQENRTNLCAATRTPEIKLFGTSPSGFNAGEEQMKTYNGMVESDVRDHMRPNIRRLIDLLMINKYGSVLDMKFMFHPLAVLTAKEEEEIKKSKHDRFRQDYMDGMLTAKEYAGLCQREGMIPMQTEVSLGKREPEPPFLTEAMGDDDPDQNRGSKPNGRQKAGRTAADAAE
jgi:phage-related protein (TIGR01555 family)